MKIHKFYNYLTLASVLVLGSCSVAPDNNKRDLSDSIEALLITGLSDVQDYYIAETNATHLSVSGLKNLDKSLEGLIFSQKDKRIQLSVNHEIIAEAILPDDENDVEELSFVLGQFIEDAHYASTILSRRDEDFIIKTLFDGILAPLDNFSRYAGPAQASDERDNREGFGGIGVVLAAHKDGAIVEAVNTGDPAEAAGIHQGDVINEINNTSLKGKSAAEVTKLLRGPENMPVIISILRSGVETPLEMTVGRKHIVPNTVFYELDSGYPVIRISSFNKRTAKRMAEAVSQAAQDTDINQKGLILDLRNNPGGLLDQSVDTADLFLRAGIISKIEGRNPQSDQLFFAENGDISASAPMIVLINGASASAAEILAAALQDHGRALIIGTNSFGKGSVQTVLSLPNNGELILTWAHFQSPQHYPLNEFGILPAICTVQTDDSYGLIEDKLIRHFDDTIMQFHTARSQLQDVEPSVTDFRRICPWQPSTNGDSTLEAAKQLMNNPDLFQRALKALTKEKHTQ